MTFTEAALEILKREGKPLHFKELTERAMTKKLLTFVGRTPEVTMQTQLTAAVKKAPGNPFVRVKPGIFGLLRYPEMTAEERSSNGDGSAKSAAAPSGRGAAPGDKGDDKSDDKNGDKRRAVPEKRAADDATDERGRRRRRRGGRGRGTKVGEGEAAAPRASEGESESPARRSAREAGEARETTGVREGTSDRSHDDTDDDGPATGGLSAEARAAALAETGVLEGDDDDMMSADDDGDSSDFPDDQRGDGGDRGLPGGHDAGSGGSVVARPNLPSGSATSGAARTESGAPGDSAEDDEEDAFGSPEGGEALKAGDSEDPARRRRRRRRRRRGGESEFGTGVEGAPSTGQGGGDLAAGDLQETARGGEGSGGSGGTSSQPSETAGDSGVAGGESSTQGEASNGGSGQAGRKIMAPVDAAIEILRGQPAGRGVHVRQIADSAIRRRLIHGEPNEAWRVIRTSLAAEPKDRLRQGMRPRVRSAGSGLYALARRPPDAELEKAEQVFGEARRALRERTIAALEKRITDLPAGAFEALARVLLQREGFGPTTFVKRVEGTIYVEALRGRGSRPSKCLIALRPGGNAAGRRAIGELRAGIRARSQDEGLLMLGGRLAEDAISEWKQPGAPLEIADGAALAETSARHGVGVLSTNVNVDFVDADFFAELAEG